MSRNLGTLILLIFTLSSCDNYRSSEGAKEKARSEAEVSGEINTNTEKRLRAERAQKMEQDLAQRFLFYQAVDGLYRGQFIKNGERHILQLSIHPSIPLYKPDRVRELSEIEHQLNDLAFIVRVQHWPESADEAVKDGDVSLVLSCQFLTVKSDLKKGLIPLRTDTCPRWYSLFLSDGASAVGDGGDLDLNFELEKIKLKSEGLAQQVFEGQVKSIDHLLGTLSIANNPNYYPLNLKKISNGGR